MAILKGWRLLRRIRCSTTRTTGLVRAVNSRAASLQASPKRCAAGGDGGPDPALPPGPAGRLAAWPPGRLAAWPPGRLAACDHYPILREPGTVVQVIEELYHDVH
ncbi:hypothetical protein ACGFNX_22025 [Streptomyces sp. NPDC048723]|uniref:hypothetical protein n=1 Tax=Streptomyces sp. NPDC048723 TaxID=3365589 RepID=UPI003716FB7E